jgi:hypothetical protein
MNAAEKPKRHDFNFSMGDDSKHRLDELMARCGHNQLNLLVARGLALLAWVEDQSDRGRIVGSIRYGDEPDFMELEERPELLRPRTRPQLVASAAPVASASPQTVSAPTPEPDPVPETPAPDPDPAPLNPKLVARPRVAPAPSAAPRERSRRAVSLAPMTPDDEGPIKTYKFLERMTKVRNMLPPIAFGGHSLPGNLYTEHLTRLTEIADRHPTATHFRINALDDELFFCGYMPRKGWCELNASTEQWAKDHHLETGLAWVYPVLPAIEYLRRHGKPSPAGAKFDETCPDY